VPFNLLTVEALDLLSELYAAFPAAEDPALHGLRHDPDAYMEHAACASARAREGLSRVAVSVRQFQRDRVAVLPALRRVVHLVRALRAAPTTAGSRDALKAKIIKDWNDGLRAERAISLAPLCEVCGARVPPRRNARKGRVYRSARWTPIEVATVCSVKCSAARKSRRSRLRQKLGRTRVTW